MGSICGRFEIVLKIAGNKNGDALNNGQYSEPLRTWTEKWMAKAMLSERKEV